MLLNFLADNPNYSTPVTVNLTPKPLLTTYNTTTNTTCPRTRTDRVNDTLNIIMSMTDCIPSRPPCWSTISPIFWLPQRHLHSSSTLLACGSTAECRQRSLTVVVERRLAQTCPCGWIDVECRSRREFPTRPIRRERTVPGITLSNMSSPLSYLPTVSLCLSIHTHGIAITTCSSSNPPLVLDSRIPSMANNQCTVISRQLSRTTMHWNISSLSTHK